MKSYVLTGLVQDQLRSLKNSGVTHFKWKDNSILLPDEDAMRLALKVLQAEGSEEPTNMEGVYAVTLTYTGASPGYPLLDDAYRHSAADLLDDQIPHADEGELEEEADLVRRTNWQPVGEPNQPVAPQTTVATASSDSPSSEAKLADIASYPPDSKLARLAMSPAWLASRVRYIAACAARIQEFVLAAKERLLSKRAKLPEAEDRFAKLTRQAAFAPNTVTQEELREKFAREIALIKETPKVNRVRVTNPGGAILIYTDTLYATAIDSEEKHEIGKFLIRILPDASSDSIRFYNATRRIDGIRPAMNAPYVQADGTIISDEIKQTFLDLIARCDFAALADLAVQFIETVNDDPPGRFITRWPGTDLTSFPVN